MTLERFWSLFFIVVIGTTVAKLLPYALAWAVQS